MEELAEDWERAVAVVAHPDDLEYGMAGAIARYTAQGKRVAYVLATRGEAGIDALAPEDCGPVREAEQRRSAEIVGVDHVEFLGHADGTVEYGLALRHDLAAALRRLQPEIVFGMNFDLTWGPGGAVNHVDHRSVGLALLDACRDAANRWMFPDAGEPWSGIRAAYLAAMEPASHFVDVTDSLDRGIASLRAHQAYIDGLGSEFDPDGFLRGNAAEAGRAAGVPAAVLLKQFSV